MAAMAAAMETGRVRAEESRFATKSLPSPCFASKRCNYGTLMFTGIPRGQFPPQLGISRFDGDIGTKGVKLHEWREGEGGGVSVVGRMKRSDRERGRGGCSE